MKIRSMFEWRIAVTVFAAVLASRAVAAEDGGKQRRAVEDQLDEAYARSVAGVGVDAVDEDYVLMTATDRNGGVMYLDFATERDGSLVPLLGEGAEPEMFGTNLGLFLTGMTDMGQPRLELQPFDVATALAPHDDVSVFIVNEELMLIALWEKGGVTGVYYALDDPGQSAGPPRQVMAPSNDPKKKALICELLYNECIKKKSEHWVLACGLWLYFCAAE